MPLSDDLRQLELNQLIMTANLFAVLDSILSSISVPASNVKAGGYPEDIFVTLSQAEKEEYECCICFQILKEAKQCINKHNFCASCIFVWSTSSTSDGSDKCPMCRTNGRYTPCYQINNKLKHKRVKCIQSNCNWIGFLCDYDEHEHRMMPASALVLPSISSTVPEARSSSLRQTSSEATPRQQQNGVIETVESVEQSLRPVQSESVTANVLSTEVSPSISAETAAAAPQQTANPPTRRRSLISASLAGNQANQIQPPRNRRRPSESMQQNQTVRGANSVRRASELTQQTVSQRRTVNNNSDASTGNNDTAGNTNRRIASTANSRNTISSNTRTRTQNTNSNISDNNEQGSQRQSRQTTVNRNQNHNLSTNAQPRLTNRARVPTSNFREQPDRNSTSDNSTTHNSIQTRPRPNEGNFTVVREESDDNITSTTHRNENEPVHVPRPPSQPRPTSLMAGASLQQPPSLSQTRTASVTNTDLLQSPTVPQQRSIPVRATSNRDPLQDVRQQQFLRISTQVRTGREQLANLMTVLSGELSQRQNPPSLEPSPTTVNHTRRMRQLQEVHMLGRRLGEVATNLAVLMSGFEHGRSSNNDNASDN